MSQESDDFSWISDPKTRKMHQDMAAWHRSPEAEQFHAETRNEADNAEKWFSGVRHLFEPAQQSEIDRAIRMTKRGMMTRVEFRNRINSHTNGMYEKAPNPPEFSVPDHLSDQFVSEVDRRFR
jgi:hypothetical protein